MVVLCLNRQVDKFLILFHNPADVSYKRLFTFREELLIF